jgi:hypothetical protein
MVEKRGCRKEVSGEGIRRPRSEEHLGVKRAARQFTLDAGFVV